MAVDPKKLKSYMAQSEDDRESEYEDEEAEGPEAEAEAEEGEEEEASEEGEELGEDDEDYADFVSDLYTHAEAIEEAATDLDGYELTHDAQPPAEVVEKMKAQLAEMPEAVAQGIEAHLIGEEYEHVIELAEELADAERISDPEQVGGWLYWIAKNV